MPFDKPQWRVWVQRKYQGDTKGIVIWKAHHSFADGISSMAMNLQLDEEYDIEKLLPFKPVGFMQRLMVRAMVPLYLPIILWESYLRRRDRNPLHDGRRKLTGEKKMTISKEFDFLTIKMASKSLKVTINELMIGALSTAVARLFKDRGDEKTKRMRIAMPCNIRWKYYETYDEVELENKFAPMPLKIDLEMDAKKALERASRVSRDMKKQFAKIYAMYFLSLVSGYLLPIFLLKLGAEKVSKPFTMAFSNTPGVLRKISYKEVETLGMTTSFICSGRLAMAIAMLSYSDQIQFSVTMDTCISECPKEIRKRFEESIEEMIEMAQKIEFDSPDQGLQQAEEKAKNEAIGKTAVKGE